MKTASKESFLELQKFTKFYANRVYLPLVLIVGLIFLLLPSILRDDPFMIGDESFYHLRISQNPKTFYYCFLCNKAKPP